MGDGRTDGLHKTHTRPRPRPTAGGNEVKQRGREEGRKRREWLLVAWLVDSRPPGQRQYNLEGEEGTVASRTTEVTAYIDTLLACTGFPAVPVTTLILNNVFIS